MFDYIKGIVEEKGNGFVVLEANGIGFRMAATLNSVQNSPAVGQEARFYTYLHTREDLVELYGFYTREERRTFEMLLSVGGVGPKAGLNILSAISPQDLALAIVTGDAKGITAAPGVGPKLAQRIILELKDKVKHVDLSAAKSGPAYAVEGNSDAVAALMALGYSSSEAGQAVAKVEQGLGVEETIKAALKQLMRV